MNTSFGARLRSQREQKRISLDEISRHTKIKVSLLEALERDDLSHWPHGLFGRAYLRAYAQAVGIEPEPLIPEYVELHPDPPDEFLNAEPAHPAGLSSAIRSAVRSIPRLRRRTDETLVAPPPPAPAAPQATLATLASVCARVSETDGGRELGPILRDVAQLLDATGVVVWSWDATAAALTPCAAHGYPAHVVAQFPPVRRHEDNAIAAAFRSMQMCTVDKGGHDTGALVVPLVTGGRCLGALSLELRDGREHREVVCHAAVIVAALLASCHLASSTPLISSQSASDVSPMNGNIRSAIA
jgi:transcriptional regulator with XRE-family HTH domain